MRMQKFTAKDLDVAKIDEQLIDQAIVVLEALQEHGLKAVTAKSSRALIAAVLSEAPGAAEHFEGGFVVTPEQKFFALKIPPAVIDAHGTVSREVAIAMAEGALQCSVADIALSVTGVAGPDTDEKGNPVGCVFFGCARRGSMTVSEKRKFGNIGRSAVLRAATSEALSILQACAESGIAREA